MRKKEDIRKFLEVTITLEKFLEKMDIIIDIKNRNYLIIVLL
jgi:hypothetical protein